MAKQENNVVTYGLSGKVGNILVFRQFDGNTIVSKAPRTSKKETEEQQAWRERFQEATFYGRSLSPEEIAEYAAAAVGLGMGRNYYNVAVADFLNAPDIKKVDFTGYAGQPGDTIVIQASDDFKVKSVRVRVTGAGGAVVEEGNATPDAKGYTWIYTATSVNDNPSGGKIEVFVSDVPGNVTTGEEAL
jgi:hypothetical protein